MGVLMDTWMEQQQEACQGRAGVMLGSLIICHFSGHHDMLNRVGVTEKDSQQVREL